MQHHFQQIKRAGEQPLVIDEEQKKAEWTRENDDISLNQSMTRGLSILYGPAGYVFRDEKGYYVELEHIKDLGQVYINIAAFKDEPMQIEKLDLEYQIYQVEQGKEILVYSQVIPYPSNRLDPHTFYCYEPNVDYWEQDIFEKGQVFILRLKHSDTCDYYLAEANCHSKISLVDNNIIRDKEYTIEIR